MATDVDFRLHPRLEADTLAAGEFGLCTLRMMNEQRYPWFILVPRRAGVRDAHELQAGDYLALWQESRALSLALMQAFGGYKLNLAALGNQVPQLHVHHVVRHTDDAAWPNPVWGAFTAVGRRGRAAPRTAGRGGAGGLSSGGGCRHGSGLT